MWLAWLWTYVTFQYLKFLTSRKICTKYTSVSFSVVSIAYNVAKHYMYLRIKIVSLNVMYGSHRCVSGDSGLGSKIISSDTTQHYALPDVNLILCTFISLASEDCSMNQFFLYAVAHAQCGRSNCCTLLRDREVLKLVNDICSAVKLCCFLRLTSGRFRTTSNCSTIFLRSVLRYFMIPRNILSMTSSSSNHQPSWCFGTERLRGERGNCSESRVTSAGYSSYRIY